MPKLDVIIDVSNVARDRRLGGGDGQAVLARYQGVCAAWQQQFPDQKGVHGVADANLRHLLDKNEQDEFDAQVRRGRVSQVKQGDADSTIIELAQRHGAKVISRDNFDDYRRTDGACWIQGNTHQFFDWKGNLETRVQIHQRDMGYKASEDIERKRRKTSAKARKADSQTLVDEASSRFRCVNLAGQCVYATDSYLPEGVNPAYQYQGGSPMCPHCGRLLERVVVGEGPRDPRELNASNAQDDEQPAANMAADHNQGQMRPGDANAGSPIGRHDAGASSLVDVGNWPLSSACLQIWRRGIECQRVELPEGRTVVFGRTRHVFDLRPFTDEDGMFISRKHLQITLDNGGQAHLTDLGSAHGTWLNADRIGPHASEPLEDGDEVTVAGDVITLVYWAPRDQ
jgi:hypothetical protein